MRTISRELPQARRGLSAALLRCQIGHCGKLSRDRNADTLECGKNEHGTQIEKTRHCAERRVEELRVGRPVALQLETHAFFYNASAERAPSSSSSFGTRSRARRRARIFCRVRTEPKRAQGRRPRAPRPSTSSAARAASRRAAQSLVAAQQSLVAKRGSTRASRQQQRPRDPVAQRRRGSTRDCDSACPSRLAQRHSGSL